MNTSSFFDFAILACPKCMSGLSGEGLMAANTAIGVMLFCLCGVLGAFLFFIGYLMKRARRCAAEDAAVANSAV